MEATGILFLGHFAGQSNQLGVDIHRSTGPAQLVFQNGCLGRW